MRHGAGRSPRTKILLAICAAVSLLLMAVQVDRKPPPADLGAVAAAPPMPEAVVLVARGAAAGALAGRCASSLCGIGGWRRPVYILADCEALTADEFDYPDCPGAVDVVLIDADAVFRKPLLFSFLPPALERVLLLDVDVTAVRPLDAFFAAAAAATAAATAAHGRAPWAAAFPDAAGHFFGFCAGCDVHHSGAVFLDRGASAPCLGQWDAAMVSGAYPSDQAALDAVVADAGCRAVALLPSAHLAFAKDYAARLWRWAARGVAAPPTLWHDTGAIRRSEVPIPPPGDCDSSWLLPFLGVPGSLVHGARPGEGG